MPPLIILSSLNKYQAKKDPRRIYLLYEGKNTEVSLVNPLLSNDPRFRNSKYSFLPLRKTDSTEGVTDPFSLIDLAKKWIKGQKAAIFEKGRDKIMIVFDLDRLQNSQEKMNRLLSEKTSDLILCYTNPSIELFILLSKNNSLNDSVTPNSKKIIENEYIKGAKERFIYHLAKKETGLDSKSSSADFRPIYENFDVILKQEGKINHCLSKAANVLTSNIAYVLTKISEDKIEEIEY